MKTTRARLAAIYIKSLREPKGNRRIELLFARYLNSGDYFSEILQVEIYRQMGIIGEESFRYNLAMIFKRYTSLIQLPPSIQNRALIMALATTICADLDNTEKELTIAERIIAIARDWLPLIFSTVPFFTFLLARRTLRLTEKSLDLAVRNFDLAERKDAREAKESQKKDNFVLEPKDDEVRVYGDRRINK